MAKPKRAGLIIVKLDPQTNHIHFRCMIPSDSAFGGDQPQMPKGCIEDGDTAVETAIKEANEEVGLVPNNLSWIRHFKNYTKMRIDVYVSMLKDSELFGDHHWETGWSGWVNYSTDREMLREDQLRIFDEVAVYIQENIAEISA